MRSGGQKRARRGRLAKAGAAAFASPFAALAVALALILQLFAVPYHQALSAPLVASPDAAAIAAELKATFGEAAALCVQADDKGDPHSPGGCCDDQCPFCRFAAQAAALVAPDAPALPLRFVGVALALGAQPEPGAVPAIPASRNRARGPPASV